MNSHVVPAASLSARGKSVIDSIVKITQRLAISNEIPREQDVNKTKDGGSRIAVLGALSHPGRKCLFFLCNKVTRQDGE